MKIRLTVLAALLALTAFASAQQFNAVYTFVCHGPQGEGTCPNGGFPSSLTQSPSGNFYGTTLVTSQKVSGNATGLVFSLTPTGTFTTVYNFTGRNTAGGSNPREIVQGSDGKLYGIAGSGGNSNAGTLFRVNTDGTGYQVLHVYSPTCANGCDPFGLVAAGDGNIYGTNFYSGTTKCYECGSIFQISVATGTYKVVAFNGINPARLVVASDGTLYGAADGPAFFHYNEAAGTLQSQHLKFVGFPASPIFGSNGNVYGFAENVEKGISLFEVQPSGANLQTFSIIPNLPITGGTTSPLVLASDGNFWIATYDGSSGYGALIEISATDGSVLQTLSPFSQTANVGAIPIALVSASDGSIWGITQEYGEAPSGDYSQGVVFNVTPTSSAR